MSPLLSQLHAAWKRIEPQLRRDPDELAKRLARRRSTTLQWPPRDWCLVVRASDRRLNPYIAAMVPEDAQDEKRPHEVTLDLELLELLCKNIRLTAPGEDAADVARMAGVNHSNLTPARFNNVFRTHYVPGLGGKRGKPVPLLYTPKTLRPGACQFAPPDEVWDYTADNLLFRIPPDFRQAIQRLPVWRDCSSIYRKINATSPEVTEEPPKKSRRLPPPPPDYIWYKWSRPADGEESHYLGDDPSNWRTGPQDDGRRPAMWRQKRKQSSRRVQYARDTLLFNGWKWQCPGCKRAVKKLFLPLPPMFLPIEIPRKLKRHELEPVPPVFACCRCHRVRYHSNTDRNGWNHVISYLSGGMLYGREVPRIKGYSRVRAYRPCLNRAPSKRRDEVRERSLKGWTYDQIAHDLGISFSTVHAHVKTIYKQERVHSRFALAAKYGKRLLKPTSPRRAEVERLLLAGESYTSIAAIMNTSYHAVHHHARNIYRAYNVHGREGLMRKLRLNGKQTARAVSMR